MMKKMVSVVLMAAFLSISTLASAAELKMVGTIEKVTVEGAAATVTLKDNSGKKVDILVKDQVTLEKLKDKRIVVGDEVRVKYDDANKNESKLFRKTAGC